MRRGECIEPDRALKRGWTKVPVGSTKPVRPSIGYATRESGYGRSETPTMPMRPTAARRITGIPARTAGVIRRAAVQRSEVADRTRPEADARMYVSRTHRRPAVLGPAILPRSITGQGRSEMGSRDEPIVPAQLRRDFLQRALRQSRAGPARPRKPLTRLIPIPVGKKFAGRNRGPEGEHETNRTIKGPL